MESTGFKDTYFLIWVLVALHANLDQYLCSHIFKSVSGAFQHQGRISDESPGEEGLSDPKLKVNGLPPTLSVREA